MLLAVPNVSEGRDARVVQEIADAFAFGSAGPGSDRAARLLDLHRDEVHNRAVVTLAGDPAALRRGIAAGAQMAAERIDMRSHEGAHPCIGALDVCPIVFRREEDRDLAREEALAVAKLIADGLDLPVFLYGELATSKERRERAFFREGGLERLHQRMASGELRPDLGPDRPHPGAGATLVTARPPLAAFNVILDTSEVETARLIAAELRESGGGLPGVRAIGLAFRGATQVSTNVHDPIAVPLAEVVGRVRVLAAAYEASVEAVELVGVVPEAALRDFPDDVALLEGERSGGLLERTIERLG